MMKKLTLAVILLMSVSCISTTVDDMNQLYEGMTKSQVQSYLGAPQNKQMNNGVSIWKYSAFKAFKGQIPYYLTFKNGELTGWQQNMHEYHQSQSLGLQGMGYR
jgi:hypothetical protein